MCPAPRKTHKHLPQRVYAKHGAFYFVDRDKKWHRLGTDLPEAMAAWAKLVEQPREIYTVSQLIDRYMLEIAPKKSKSSYYSNLKEIQHLRKAFGHMSPGAITPVHIYQYLDIRGQKAPVGANREKALLSHMFTIAIRWGIVRINPCRDVRRLKEIRRDRYVTDEEFEAIRALASPMIQCIMDFAYLTGLRQSDVLSLKKSALGKDGIYIEVNKTKNKLLFEWTEDLREILTTAEQLQMGHSDYLFVSKNGRPYKSSGFQTIWQRLMVDAVKTGAIKERFRFHDIRRKTATDVENNSSRESARRLLGHTDQKTTAIYISGVQKVKPLK